MRKSDLQRYIRKVQLIEAEDRERESSTKRRYPQLPLGQSKQKRGKTDAPLYGEEHDSATAGLKISVSGERDGVWWEEIVN